MATRVAALGVGAFFAALVLVPILRRVADRHGVTAAPREDRLHSTPTPYLGGVAIIIACTVAAAFSHGSRSEIAAVVGGAVLLGVVGLLDDLRGLGPIVRVCSELLAGLLAVVVGHAQIEIVGGPLDVALTVAWLVVMTNAFNLIDNMDGAAGGLAAATATLLTLAAFLQGQMLVAELGAVVAGSCLAFLVFNWHPARIFMGDAGALPVGYLLAVVALKLRFPTDQVGSITAVVLFSTPALLDTTLVVVSRVARRQPIYVGGTDHSAHRLLRLGLSARVVASLIVVQAAAFGLLGIGVGRGRLSPGAIAGGAAFVSGCTLVFLLRLPAEAGPSEARGQMLE